MPPRSKETDDKPSGNIDIAARCRGYFDEGKYQHALGEASQAIETDPTDIFEISRVRSWRFENGSHILLHSLHYNGHRISGKSIKPAGLTWRRY